MGWSMGVVPSFAASESRIGFLKRGIVRDHHGELASTFATTSPQAKQCVTPRPVIKPVRQVPSKSVHR